MHARADVRERKHAHPGIAGQNGGFFGCAVTRLDSPVAIFGGERGLVHQKIGTGRGDRRARAWTGIA